MRKLRIWAAAVLVLLFELPAAAAPTSNHHKEVEDQSIYTSLVEDILNERCPFSVEVEIEGWAQYKDDLTNWHSRLVFTNLDSGDVLTLVDTGPDRVFEKDGHTYLSIIGRSPTGSGWIGRVVYDLDTEEVVRASGRQLHDGDFFEYVCEALQ